MTQRGFEDYVFAAFNSNSNAAASYIKAIHIIDEMFKVNDVFQLNGKSLTCIEDAELLARIAKFIYEQQALYKKGLDSFFQNIGSTQSSYARGGFCSAAIKQLLLYSKYDVEEKLADTLINNLKNKTSGAKISKELITLFAIDKEGKDKVTETKIRIGQSYFRRMVLANYDGKCCVTGLNVPQTLRASHIVAWKEDKRYRMDPENGLCLSATYDAAFDKHLITFDENYRMIVSKHIKDYYTNEVTKEYFENFEGKQIILPLKYMPSQYLLSRHRDLFID